MKKTHIKKNRSPSSEEEGRILFEFCIRGGYIERDKDSLSIEYTSLQDNPGYTSLHEFFSSLKSRTHIGGSRYYKLVNINL